MQCKYITIYYKICIIYILYLNINDILKLYDIYIYVTVYIILTYESII